jgi:RNA polymerase sigma factor (sigma-70 family)
LRALLAELSEEQQLCIKLFHFNGMSYAEIANLTCLEEKSVKSHIQNGMRRMRRSQAGCGSK